MSVPKIVSTPLKQVSLRLDAEFHKKLQHALVERDVSFQSLIMRLLESWLDNPDVDPAVAVERPAVPSESLELVARDVRQALLAGLEAFRRALNGDGE